MWKSLCGHKPSEWWEHARRREHRAHVNLDSQVVRPARSGWACALLPQTICRCGPLGRWPPHHVTPDRDAAPATNPASNPECVPTNRPAKRNSTAGDLHGKYSKIAVYNRKRGL
ncbi:hypothetical protein GCM10022270_08280 [Terriglobus aquaticus]